jgi:F0F1-type ATP synthase membrane subunit c/vacuolar-type H+-ATPase subunit K
MKRTLIVICLLVGIAVAHQASAQCSICTKTAQQLGHKPAKGLNSGIIYLMIAPMAIIGFVGYRWYRSGGAEPGHDQMN